MARSEEQSMILPPKRDPFTGRRLDLKPAVAPDLVAPSLALNLACPIETLAIENQLAFPLQVASRLPLAEASLRLLDLVTQTDFLTGIFQRHRGRSYEKVISFATFVHLIADALLENYKSARKSFRAAQEKHVLEATLPAIYGKLARLPLSLSKGFLLEASARLQSFFPQAARTPLPPSLADWQVLALDGKKLKHVAKRLKCLRPVRGQVYGGKLVVALWINTRLVVAMEAHPDGEASDAPLVPGVLAQTRKQIKGKRLWLVDAQFCDLNQPALLTKKDDQFIMCSAGRIPISSSCATMPRLAFTLIRPLLSARRQEKQLMAREGVTARSGGGSARSRISGAATCGE
jgi:hypothetical protein